MKKLNLLMIFALLFSFSGCIEVNQTTPTEWNSSENELPLKSLAANHNLQIGGACEMINLEDEDLRALLIEHFDILTPENSMKMKYTQPEPGIFYFTKSDQLVAFAEENGMAIHGHTLVWHYQTPSWLSDNENNWTREELLEVMETHVKTVAGHFKGKVEIWDVVNEPITKDGYRETIWYKVIGPEYIELALRYAHEADPNAKLYINTYGTQTINQKSDVLYDIVVDLLERDVPLDGIGVQLHVKVQDNMDLDEMFNSMVANLQRFEALGLEIGFTEVDVRIPGIINEKKLSQQGEIYQRLMILAAGMDSVKSFTTWGVTDNHTWITVHFPGYSTPLLFDRNNQPKPAFYAVEEILLQDEIDLQQYNE